MEPTEFEVTADWVAPVTQPALRRGFVKILNGRIVAVNTERTLPRGQVIDLGSSILMPGLVNAHTHLEFSDLAQPLGFPGVSFAEWIALVVRQRGGDTIEQRAARQQEAIGLGIDESRRAGVVAVGEISTNPWPWPTSAAGGRSLSAESTSSGLPSGGVLFLEQLGAGVHQSDDRLAAIDLRLKSASRLIAGGSSPPGWSLGISPHAPYSVHRNLFSGLLQRARRFRLPVAVHLAETQAELELLDFGTGPLRSLLDAMGLWESPQQFLGISEILAELSTCSRSLVIHGNYLSASQIAQIAEARDRISVVYCPRTHRYFQHATHPLEKLVAAGVNVAIGTDSRASNPNLDLLGELQLISIQFPALSPSQVLSMGTANGAVALGLEREIGSIEAGRRADLLIVPVPVGEESEAREDPIRWLLSACPVRRLHLSDALTGGFGNYLAADGE